MKKFVAGTLTACILISGISLTKASTDTVRANPWFHYVFGNGQYQKPSDSVVFKFWCLDIWGDTQSPDTEQPETELPEQPETEVPDAPEAETPDVPETPNVPETPDVPETEQPGEEQSPDTQNGYAQEVLSLVNQERAKQGLSALVLDSTLSAVAYAHSKDMSDRNFFSHTNPDGLSPFDRMKAQGISYRTAAENIAVGQTSPAQVVNSWMNSEGHRKNILNANFNKMGIGLYQSGSGYKYYWTQCFTD